MSLFDAFWESGGYSEEDREAMQKAWDECKAACLKVALEVAGEAQDASSSAMAESILVRLETDV